MKTSENEIIEVVKAHQEGKKIEFKMKSEGPNDWDDLVKPGWDFLHYDYRIKPESNPNYRSYESNEEVLEDMKKHGPMIRFKDSTSDYYTIEQVTLKGCYVIGNSISYIKAFKECVWQDGTPFGYKIGEGDV